MDFTQQLSAIDKVIAEGHYKDNWDSLTKHPIPDWYQEGRFGLFIHWGVYSVPAYYSEWYPRLMHYKASPVYSHHVKTYGSLDKFEYRHFIPMFKAEKFDADEWLRIFKDSGAKYIMPVGEHHDGFKMYYSDLSRWNSKEMGPCRDILGELHDACDKAGIGFCTSSHRAEHFWFLNGAKDHDCEANSEEYRDFYGDCVRGIDNPMQSLWACEKNIVPTKEWLEDWLVSTCDMVDRNKPLAIYFDWWVREPHFRPYMKKFLAYYYNRGIEWGKQVTVFYKWDCMMYGAGIYDVERGQLAGINPVLWQNDTAIAKNSWGYTEGNKFKTSAEVICNLVDVISKNGCFMLNVGPKADGTICDEEKAVLRDIGVWLRINGEGIYNVKPYKVYGENKKQKRMGSFKESVEYTSRDYRYTYQPGYIYAFAMGVDKKGKYVMNSLCSANDKCNYVIENIELLGYDNKLTFEVSGEALTINVEGVINTDKPICFKIKVD